MSQLLLDTMFVIDTERSAEELDVAISDDDDVAIAAISVAELLVGVHLAADRRKATRQSFAEHIIETLPVVPYDTTVAVEHGALLAEVRRLGRPRGAHNLLIAATARATGRTIVTADLAAYADLPGVATRSYR